MGSIPFAFSVHNFIKSVGADAGFASIIGLAILVLLYFAQARETSSLREQSYEAAQRVQQLEGRIAQLTRELAARVVPGAPAVARAPAPVVRPLANSVPAATAGAAAAAPGGVRVPVVAGAPAGVGAPALTAATKLIPTPLPSVPQPVAGASAPPQPQPVDLTAMVPPAPPPATVAGGANGSGQEHFSDQFAAPVAAAPPPGAPPPPRVQIRPGAAAPGRRPAVPPPARGRPARGGPSVGRRVAAGLAVLVALGVVVGGLLLLTNGNGSKQASTSTSRTSNAPTKQHHRSAPAVPAFSPASVTVSVLNGTATSGLAGRVSAKLTVAGYKQGTVATAADQTRTATIVAYEAGHRNDALHVANSLKIPVANVQQVDSTAQAVACPSGSCTATVVVTVGSDLATTQ